MKFTDGFMIHSGQPVRDFVDSATRHVLMRQGVLGIKVKIMKPWDPEGRLGPSKPLPDVVTSASPPSLARPPALLSRLTRSLPLARAQSRSPSPTSSTRSRSSRSTSARPTSPPRPRRRSRRPSRPARSSPPRRSSPALPRSPPRASKRTRRLLDDASDVRKAVEGEAGEASSSFLLFLRTEVVSSHSLSLREPLGQHVRIGASERQRVAPVERRRGRREQEVQEGERRTRDQPVMLVVNERVRGEEGRRDDEAQNVGGEAQARRRGPSGLVGLGGTAELSR